MLGVGGGGMSVVTLLPLLLILAFLWLVRSDDPKVLLHRGNYQGKKVPTYGPVVPTAKYLLRDRIV